LVNNEEETIQTYFIFRIMCVLGATCKHKLLRLKMIVFEQRWTCFYGRGKLNILNPVPKKGLAYPCHDF